MTSRHEDSRRRPALSGAADVSVVDAAALRAPATIAGVHDLLSRLVAERAGRSTVQSPDQEEIDSILEHLAQDVGVGDAGVALATLEGRVVGAGWWRRYSRPAHRPHADLKRVGVLPSAQGTGLSLALVQALVQSARDAGVEVLTVDHRGDRDGVHRLYERVGFVEYGRLRDFVAVGDRRWDKVLMSLDLRQPPNGG
jgi:GNAT superfamily N-acetyltransferase